MDYSGLTQNQFDLILMSILSETKASELITVPGIYEILAEEFNNEVLKLYEDQNPPC